MGIERPHLIAMVKWQGQKQCDFCGDSIRNHRTFYDATTKAGYWALMCDECFSRYGIQRLGTGWGQEYDGKTLEKLRG